MYPRTFHLKTGQYINIYSVAVNNLLDEGYSLDEIIKQIEYPVEQKMILPKDVNTKILLSLDDKALGCMCQTNHYMKKLMSSTYFWKTRFNSYYDINTHFEKYYYYLYKLIKKINNKIVKYKYAEIELKILLHKNMSIDDNHNNIFIYKCNANIKEIILSFDCITQLFNHQFDPISLYSRKLDDNNYILIYDGIKYH